MLSKGSANVAGAEIEPVGGILEDQGKEVLLRIVRGRLLVAIVKGDTVARLGVEMLLRVAEEDRLTNSDRAAIIGSVTPRRPLETTDLKRKGWRRGQPV